MFNTLLFDKKNFYKPFIRDLLRSKSEVVIESSRKQYAIRYVENKVEQYGEGYVAKRNEKYEVSYKIQKRNIGLNRVSENVLP